MPPIPKTPKEILAEFETKIMGNDLAFGTKEGTLNLLRGLFISLLLEAKGGCRNLKVNVVKARIPYPTFIPLSTPSLPK